MSINYSSYAIIHLHKYEVWVVLLKLGGNSGSLTPCWINTINKKILRTQKTQFVLHKRWIPLLKYLCSSPYNEVMIYSPQLLKINCPNERDNYAFFPLVPILPLWIYLYPSVKHLGHLTCCNVVWLLQIRTIVRTNMPSTQGMKYFSWQDIAWGCHVGLCWSFTEKMWTVWVFAIISM